MAKVTKTINRLHFEDLEPHRFEDLVRQLIYDFREWRSLEATGRQGSDDGFDVRGWEGGDTAVQADDQEVDNHEPEADDGEKGKDRIWLIQCKRERSITPKKLLSYLNDITLNGAERLHGLIFVAACDFSKKSRDSLREWCINTKISEYYLWGCAELEDLLFQPKFDHLLFAYFGISIQIRKRSIKTSLRSVLSIKRQTVKHLGGINNHRHQAVLLRDPEALEYPNHEEIENFQKQPEWRVYEFAGHYHAGLQFIIRTHFAYIADDGIQWDYEERVGTTSHHYDDPWFLKEENKLEPLVHEYWRRLPALNQGTLEIVGRLPYDEILAIDENGDEHFPHSHIYVHFDSERGPFADGAYGSVVTYAPTRKYYPVRQRDRTKYFPEIYSEISDHENDV